MDGVLTDFTKAEVYRKNRGLRYLQKQDVKKVTRHPYIENDVFLSRDISGISFLIAHIFCAVIILGWIPKIRKTGRYYVSLSFARGKKYSEAEFWILPVF